MGTLSDWDIANSSIIDKFLNGNINWTAEELQYQQNYPEDIENALALANGAIAKCECQNEILLVPSYYSISLRSLLWNQYINKGIPVKRVIPASTAVAIALFCHTKVEKTVAIVILKENYIDLSIVSVGWGVFETKFITGKGCSTANYKDNVFAVCLEYLKRRGEIEHFNGVDELIVVSEYTADKNQVGIIEQAFEMKSTLITGLSTLYDRGSEIQKGVLDGNVCDVLSLELLPYPIAVELDTNNTIEVFGCETIPMKKDIVIDIPSNGSICIKEGNAPNKITVKRIFIDNHSQVNKMMLSVDINTSGVLRTRVTPLTEKEVLRVKRENLRKKLTKQ